MAKKTRTGNMQAIFNDIEKKKEEPKKTKPLADPQPKASEQAAENQEPEKTSKMIEGLRKNKPAKQYASFRMHSDILEKYKEIADKENIKYPGELIHKVLENFIQEYETEK